MAETRPSDAATRILSYFMLHREAMDTHEGIVRWRLREEAIHQTTEETQEALAWLVARGFLCEVRRAGSPPLFHLNPEKSTDAGALLDAEPGRRGGESRWRDRT